MKRLLQIVGLIIVGLIILLIVVIGFVFAQSNAKFNKIWEVDVASLDIVIDDDTLAEGERLFVTRGCGDCHSENGAGTLFIDDPALGQIPAPNLTSGEGGVGQFYTTEDYIRAIQHGIRPDGTSLMIMPSEDWQQMRAEELSPLLAYLLNLEPVDNVLPDRQPGPIGRALVVFGELPLAAELIDHDTAGLIEVEYGASVEFGEYIARNCSGCHGADFSGSVLPPENIETPNITSHEDGIGTWSLEEFIPAMQTGVTPDGRQLSDAMPWRGFGQMTPEELEGLYLYLQTTEPVAE